MIFQPVDPAGPAHRGNQTLQQLAQGAAQNVLRRQKLRSLIAQGARGAGTSAGQPFRSSFNTRPGGAKSSVLMRLLGGDHGPGSINLGHGNDGAFSAGGGGYDYPSLPGGDPRQSAANTAENPTASGTPGHPGAIGSPVIDPKTGQPLAGGSQWVGDPATPGNTVMGGGDGGAYHDVVADPNFIHLGNGVYYDPSTDSVVGGGNAHTGGSTY